MNLISNFVIKRPSLDFSKLLKSVNRLGQGALFSQIDNAP